MIARGLQHDPEDPGVFVRSMAARDRLGGLAELSIAAMVLLRALYDVVILETVGVGQSETDVADSADTVVFCVQPGSGDSLQFMKAGIVEIPHLVVVTKADMGAAAKRARADVEGALGLAEAGDWPVEVLSLAALRGEGVEPLIAALDRRWAWLADAGRLAAPAPGPGPAMGGRGHPPALRPRGAEARGRDRPSGRIALRPAERHRPKAEAHGRGR